MVICNSNVVSYAMLRDVIGSNSSRDVLADILIDPIVFFDTVEGFFDDMTSGIDQHSVPMTLVKALYAIEEGKIDAFLQKNAAETLAAILHAEPSFGEAYEQMKAADAVVLSQWMLICYLCKPLGLRLCVADFEDYLPKQASAPTDSGESEYEREDPLATDANDTEAQEPLTKKSERRSCNSTQNGFCAKDGMLSYKNAPICRIKTVAANGAYCVAAEGESILLFKEGKCIRTLAVKDAGELQLCSEGDLLYLDLPRGTEHGRVHAISDADYFDGNAVQISASGYQYAILTPDGSFKSNIPVKRKLKEGLPPLISVFVSSNLLLGITEDHRVFSSEEGMLDAENVKKALRFDEGLAFLHTDGTVRLSTDPRPIASGIEDIACGGASLFLLGGGEILEWTAQRKRRIRVECGAGEMAASDRYLIYRTQKGGAVIEQL